MDLQTEESVVKWINYSSGKDGSWIAGFAFVKRSGHAVCFLFTVQHPIILCIYLFIYSFLHKTVVVDHNFTVFVLNKVSQSLKNIIIYIYIRAVNRLKYLIVINRMIAMSKPVINYTFYLF